MRLYLGELPSLLQWQEVADAMSIRHEDDKLAEKVLKTLTDLTSNADDDILTMSSKIIEDIVSKMVIDLTCFLEKVVRLESENRSVSWDCDTFIPFLLYNSEGAIETTQVSTFMLNVPH